MEESDRRDIKGNNKREGAESHRRSSWRISSECRIQKRMSFVYNLHWRRASGPSGPNRRNALVCVAAAYQLKLENAFSEGK